MMTGSCHCGAVKYESAGRVLRFAQCHCPDCRKISGSPFGTGLVVTSKGFTVTDGEAELTAYESSPGKYRNFCRRCGTHLFARMDEQPRMVIIRAGSIDSGLDQGPHMHIWVGAKAAWHEITDALPRHEGWPPK